MIQGRVSVIIPSRNERYLRATVQDVLAKARGDIELIVVLEGYWPDPALPADPRLILLHHGKAQGMRPAINAAVQMARGEFLCKMDAHVMVDEGFDLKLKADYLETNWILTPRRFALDAEHWRIDESNPKYPIDYEYLAYGMERPDDPTCGFHGTPWTQRRDARTDILLDKDLSSQGSLWFMVASHWSRVGPMNVELFGSFYGESQEIGLATQLQGGSMMRTKRTWYAHLRKGQKHGRGYSLGQNGHRRGAGVMLRRCMLDEWPKQTKKLIDVLRPFAPIPSWPADLEQCFADARQTLKAVA